MWEILEYVGETLVFIGVVGEVYAEWGEVEKKKVGKAFSLVLIVGLALSLAALIATNEGFNGKIADLNGQAARSNQLAAAAQLDAANARKDTAQLQSDAATAKREMAQAQLELARFTGPIQSVPVINGVASPDPTKGSKLRILLHADTLIKFPTLPKGKALSWTLFIVEDEIGQHQFRTFPKQFMPPNVLFMPPGSSATMDLVTDETGTSDHTLGGATLATPPPETVVIK
jgi:hypothetical protein